MQTRTITLVLAGALGGAVVTAGLLLSQRATAAPPSALPLHTVQVACPVAMVTRAEGWTLSSGPWKPSVVTPPASPASAPSAVPASTAPIHGPFTKDPDGTY